jgi:hypothetical protein
MSLDAKIEKLSVAFGRRIVEAFRASLAAEIRSAAFGKVAQRARSVKRASTVRRGAYTTPKTCIKPGCKHRPTGPRYSYLCVDHRDKATKAERKGWLAAWHEANK